MVNHFTNPWIESDGRRTRFPVFLGAVHHIADATAVAKAGYTGTVAYANEPSVGVQANVGRAALAVWEDWST